MPLVEPTLPEPTTEPLYILLLDSRSDSALAGLLEQCGHGVFPASDMRTGLALAEHCRFDLVISNTVLPDGSGYEFMEHLRRIQPSLQAVSLSPFGAPAELERSSAAGFSRHLVEPLTPRSFQAAIAAVSQAAPASSSPTAAALPSGVV